MKYRLVVRRDAERDMKRLPDDLLKRINAKVSSLLDNPYQRGVKKLGGGFGFRTQAGNYRILYGIDDRSRVVTVLQIRHRREAYK